MLLKRGTIIIGSLIILIVSFSSMSFGQDPPKGIPEARALELKGLLASIEGVAEESPRVHLTKDGYLRFIMAPASTHFFVEPVWRGTPEEGANWFLQAWRNLFVNESPAVGFDIIRITTGNSRSYVRYQETYAGLKVFGAQMIIQVNKAGGIQAVISDIMGDTTQLDTGKVSLSPSIDAVSAQRAAIDWLAAQHVGLEFEATAARLMMFCPPVVGDTGPTQLVWQTEVANVAEAFIRELVLVNAQSGRIAFHYPLIYEGKYREIYDEQQGSALVREEGDPPTGIADVDNAYDYLGATYDFYGTEHGRDSIDDGGITLLARVRFTYCNAYWKGKDHWLYPNEMHFGNGLTFDDVVAHEYTHGVTDYESNLNYSGESGAINESFSDMWGEWVDQGYTNGNDTDSPAVKWLIGEDVVCTGGAIRDMADPPAKNHPDRLYGPYWDWGGEVHINSGVGNKLCYLLTDGDTFNSYTISGMGISKTADLFYECQTNLLTSSGDYYDLGNVLILAACNLGLTPAERDNVKNACVAVEILPYPYDCLPICHPDYVDWVLMGRPDCWCTPYQCDGDADVATSGWPFYYRVYNGDLSLIIDNWEKKIDDPTLNPCADIDHKAQGLLQYRVYTNDLSILVANWEKTDAELPGDCAECGRGQQASVSVSFDEMVKWLDEVWLDPEVRKLIDADRWERFVLSVLEGLEAQSANP